MLRILRALVVLLASAAPTFAQDAPPEPADHKQILTTNPLLLVGGYLNVEFERKVSESMTLGITASTFDGFFDDDVRYTNGTLIGRYYPQGRPLNGFYLGGKIGVHHVAEDYFFDQQDRDETLVGVGADLGYTWLLGKRDKFVLGLGGGAMRLFGGDELSSGLFIPSARINVGIAF
ncbi:MAG: DUF3575 domain-containing protein [Acidobacteriota bacterium]|nr:DUF3575 domain-containing protein [Acidobacteriota bacterium]